MAREQNFWALSHALTLTRTRSYPSRSVRWTLYHTKTYYIPRLLYSWEQTLRNIITLESLPNKSWTVPAQSVPHNTTASQEGRAGWCVLGVWAKGETPTQKRLGPQKNREDLVLMHGYPQEISVLKCALKISDFAVFTNGIFFCALSRLLHSWALEIARNVTLVW